MCHPSSLKVQGDPIMCEGARRYDDHLSILDTYGRVASEFNVKAMRVPSCSSSLKGDGDAIIS